jgi:hypothetical protein
MSQKQRSFTFYILLSVILLVVVAKCLNLNRIKFNVDDVETQLAPVGPKIIINSRVGFYTNIDDVPGYGVYLQSKGILTPKILIDQIHYDTLLTIQYKTAPLKSFTNYRVIAKSENQESVVQLITKIK